MAKPLPPIRLPFTKDYAYLPAIEFIFKGTFIGKTFYWVMREWFMEHGYLDLCDEVLLYFVERIYVEKRFADRDIRSRWRVTKYYQHGALSDFTKWFVDIDLRMVNITDVEMVVDGRKLKALQGEIRMELRGRIETDVARTHAPAGSFAKHWLLGAINTLFQKRLYKQELEGQRKEMYRELYRFNGMMKKFFDMHIFVPDMELFHKRMELA
ncbi:MAG: hypothetical protein EPN86_02300 [Nanoarchaeota archaeon]|nr:MAG: hypothetical protein EPN86_02300 [Nanoarchaeota archaeon]